MQVSYKRDLNNNYLILKATESIDTEGYQIRLLSGNHVAGFLTCMIQTINNQVLFYYEITAKQSFANIYEHQKIGREDLQLLFECLIKKIEEMRSFLLSADGLLLNPEYIYFSACRKELSFCYFPAQQKEITVSLQELAEYLLPKIDHTDHAAVVLGYNIYRCIMEEGVSLEQIKKELYRENTVTTPPESLDLWEENKLIFEEPPEDIVQSLLEENEEVVHPAIASIIISITGIMLFVYFYFISNTEFSWHIYVVAAVALLVIAGISAGLYLFKMQGKKVAKEKSSSKELDDGYGDNELKIEESWLNAQAKKEDQNKDKGPPNGDETIILKSSEISQMPCLIGVYPPMLQSILVKKDVFLLGKLETVVDAVLPSFAVSRIHARITKEGDYYLTDLNSLNGTYVNHKILSGDEKHLLSDGDEIAFGDLIYCFKEASS